MSIWLSIVGSGKKRNYIFSAFTKNGTFYVKQNENWILNMNVLHDMFPNLYDMSKEGNENCDIRRPKCLCFVTILSLIRAALLHLRMWGVCLIDLSHSVYWLYREVLVRWGVLLNRVQCTNNIGRIIVEGSSMVM